MKLELGDNATDGIRFLLLGGGVLLLLRLAYAGLEFWLHPPVTADWPVLVDGFRNGYLLNSLDIIVIGSAPLAERIALAILVTGCIAGALAFLAAMIAKLFHRSVAAAATATLRVSLVVLGAWCIFAATARPPRTVQVTADGLRFNTMPALLGAITLPFGGTTSIVPSMSIERYVVTSESDPDKPCGVALELVAEGPAFGQRTVARIVPDGTECPAAIEAANTKLMLVEKGLKRSSEKEL